jgi:dTDP-4-amino-4,6-dideoxygalactose transaminase
MYRLKFLCHCLGFRSRYFLQPLWSRRAREIVEGCLAGREMPGAESALEQEVCRLSGASYALGLNSGRSAIQVALEALKLPPQSEVILPSFSCTGVIMPVVQAGLQPVLADIDRDFNLSFASVKEALTPATRVIILPHLSGKFARDTQKILEVARQHRVKIIEDACQSFGLTWEGRWAGSIGDIGIFSFGLGKNLFGPGGGMLVTDDEEVILSCRSRQFPWENFLTARHRLITFILRYCLQRWTFPFYCFVNKINTILMPNLGTSLNQYGFPVYRISDVDAAWALLQVNQVDIIIKQRQANANFLLENSAVWASDLDLPDKSNNIFTKFLLGTGKNPKRARAIRNRLYSHGIETESSYTPLHLRAPFSQFRKTSMLETESRWLEAFSLPINPRLSSQDLNRIVTLISQMQE